MRTRRVPTPQKVYGVWRRACSQLVTRQAFGARTLRVGSWCRFLVLRRARRLSTCSRCMNASCTLPFGMFYLLLATRATDELSVTLLSLTVSLGRGSRVRSRGRGGFPGTGAIMEPGRARRGVVAPSPCARARAARPASPDQSPDDYNVTWMTMRRRCAACGAVEG